MSAQILDGKALASKIRENIKNEIELLKNKGIIPGLAVIIAGDDPSSRIYVDLKKKECSEVGIYSCEISLESDISQEALKEIVQDLNKKREIHGILIQLPLPPHLNEKEILEEISPDKDVDGFHPINAGKLLLGRDCFLPCTPAGVMEFFKEYNINIEGKECVVVGRSNIVGKPQALLMLRENATVTVCHSKTKNLAQVCRRADILIVGVGKPQLIKGDMIKPGAVVIDVGMNRLPDKKLLGDVDFESAVQTAGYITPVPGGVGPMTRIMLLKNTIRAVQKAYDLL